MHTDLFTAIGSGDAEGLSGVLKSGVSFDDDALAMAAGEGQAGCVAVLLEHGACVDQRDWLGVNTPLSCAAVACSASCISTLLAHGAKVNLLQTNGNTSTTLSAQSGDITCLSLLLSAGADVDLGSPLCCGITHLPVVLLLLEHGADPNLPALEGYTPMQCAVRHGDDRVVEALVSYGGVVDHTALYEAEVVGDMFLYRLLQSFGAEEEGGRTLSRVHECAAEGAHTVLRDIIAKEPGLANACTPAGNTPLCYALMKGHMNVIEVLVEACGTGLSTVCAEGSVLGLASAGCAYRAFRLLIDEAGADVNLRCASDGSTPLHIAAGGGLVQIARLLRARGADFLARDKNGDTPLHRAAQCGALASVTDSWHPACHMARNDCGETPAKVAEKSPFNSECLKYLQRTFSELRKQEKKREGEEEVDAGKPRQKRRLK